METTATTAQTLTAIPNWIARKADGTLDFNGYRMAYLEEGVWHFVGATFSMEK